MVYPTYPGTLRFPGYPEYPQQQASGPLFTEPNFKFMDTNPHILSIS